MISFRRSLFQLNQISEFFDRNIICMTKSNINDCIIQQAAHFKYLGGGIRTECDNNIEEKLQKFQSVCGIVNRTLKGKFRNNKVMTIPTLLCGSET
jgi:hypothetical protein